jgi:hypothetical protein
MATRETGNVIETRVTKLNLITSNSYSRLGNFYVTHNCVQVMLKLNVWLVLNPSRHCLIHLLLLEAPTPRMGVMSFLVT